MRAVAVLLCGLVLPAPVMAKCYSVWRYPTPQHCGGVYSRMSPAKRAFVAQVPNLVPAANLYHDAIRDALNDELKHVHDSTSEFSMRNVD